MIELIDSPLLETRRVLGKDFFAGLINKFEADYPNLLANLEDLYRSESFEAFEDEAHKLKGIALNLGAQALGDLCKAMQLQRSKGKPEMIPVLLDLVRPIAEASIKGLRLELNHF
ncbi:MAG: hypothetical protein A2600_08755 [Candidatus Lambdaproteobacteria bacterium RIFOXYD1_FULL_56_27]|uniref:HPt domain-containing protein n=1 Tax=Candidatus Lambdaproteobacteria bacterium RIFOXYD2_FULL_56_26 TaxID=1817773 RepID=A0A1F6GYZ8_9PROT|nr:MAG: hypothetical protein A2426_10175 [Candidatus Lambdaproteobacteria bacterium RIFOXYC1_FULL_56_13]OGH03375.1 MAG: hypothetical protein A2557_02510 [Candidatus Lambdaproteobacteria bacterium RIFOXYD2_FULL_56_26]OGH06620.1 MAG: hypothetical protein A2600_08755 [Candidatus Lambdaproteobacteria bacterium RIFOXYD1_FULL_56_27]